MFFFYIYEKGLAAGELASLMNLTWLRELNLANENIPRRTEGKVDDDDNLTENRGRKKLLTADHKRYLEETFGENSSTTIDQAMDSLANNFEGLKVSKQTVRDFMVDEYALSHKEKPF
ncbi:hypothetical protein HMPREF1544_04028 [Mucor circinelloides 1006PhL]|uniref:Uncharacterized protein n=1 Tax=Mucor circinelloides f. circinelloides (strain 1006PhL) TaxID=1220926 RepID=S2JFT6_MUCC1|nr:hypothetical protein HMPREF1544_04028 [Mucor circinelloides 1006PhL]